MVVYNVSKWISAHALNCSKQMLESDCVFNFGFLSLWSWYHWRWYQKWNRPRLITASYGWHRSQWVELFIMKSRLPSLLTVNFWSKMTTWKNWPPEKKNINVKSRDTLKNLSVCWDWAYEQARKPCRPWCFHLSSSSGHLQLHCLSLQIMLYMVLYPNHLDC